MIYPIFLCGDSVTRLWLLSLKSFPTQSAPLIDNKSVLQLMLKRVVFQLMKNTVENPRQNGLGMIRVQSGSYLCEDDIVRYEDTHGRLTTLSIET